MTLICGHKNDQCLNLEVCKCVGTTLPPSPSHNPSPHLGLEVWQLKGYEVMPECGLLTTVL